MAYIDDQNTQRANLNYISQSMNTPLLSREEEQALSRAWRDHQDTAAMHKLINAYGRLVIAVAAKFRYYGLPIGDLIQEGNIGLLEAIKRFEPDRDIRFSTYATWWIKSCMQDYVLRNWSIVRTGTTAAQKSLFFNLRRLRAKIEGEQEAEGLTDEGRAKIADDLNVKLSDVKDMEQRMSSGDQSLNVIISEDSESDWMSLLADNRPTPEEVVIGMKDAQTRSKWLNDALRQLSDREQKIINDRHLTYETVTLEELGKELGVSKERVRQLEQRAMHKLRTNLQREDRIASDIFLET